MPPSTPLLPRLLLLLAPALTVLALPVHAASALELATELTTLTELDRAALFGARLAVEQGARLGYIGQAAASCMAGKPHEPLTAPIARYLAAQLTKKELQAAVGFYGSELGRRLVQQENQAFVDGLTPGSQTPPPTPFSKAEQAQVDAFTRSPAGRKLITRSVMRNAGRDPAIAKVIMRMHDDCVPR